MRGLLAELLEDLLLDQTGTGAQPYGASQGYPPHTPPPGGFNPPLPGGPLQVPRPPQDIEGVGELGGLGGLGGEEPGGPGGLGELLGQLIMRLLLAERQNITPHPANMASITASRHAAGGAPVGGR